MIHIRVRYKHTGMHVAARFFMSVSKETTHANCGMLLMTNDEFDALRHGLESGAELLHERCVMDNHDDILAIEFVDEKRLSDTERN